MKKSSKTDAEVFLGQLAHLQDSMKAFGSGFAQIAEMQKRMQESFRPILEAHEIMRQATQPSIQAHQYLRECAARAQTVFDQYTRTIQPAMEFQRQVMEHFRPAAERIAQGLKDLPERARQALLILGHHGWFLDLELPMVGLWKLAEALRDGNVADAEQALMGHYRNRTPEIVDRLKKDYPHRARILDAAFKAHSGGEYVLAIPVLLAQADGICQERMGVQLYKKQKKAPVLAAYVAEVATDALQAAFLHPLTQPLPISAGAKDRGEDFKGLNRHQVLHGESVDYGSEVNSLRAISLLNYVATLLKQDFVGKNARSK